MNESKIINIQKLIILYFLNGLRPEYKIFYNNLISSDAVLKQQFVIKKLK